MRFRLPKRPLLGLGIGAKFLLAFALVVPALLAVPIAALHGLSQIRDDATGISSENVHESRVTQEVSSGLDDAYALALRIIPTDSDRARLRRLDAKLATVVIPAVTADLERLRRAHADDSRPERARVRDLQAGWRRFIGLWSSGAFNTRGLSIAVARRNEATAAKVGRIVDPLSSLANRMVSTEEAQASRAAQRARAQYRSTRSLILSLAAVAMLLCFSALVWLMRDIVPRIRRYSRFAALVASGTQAEPVVTRGADELSELGRRLNEMVLGGRAEHAYRETQAEFSDAMQLTEGEDEAHGLLKRHIERSISDTDVVVLNRNNSRDRLEPTTRVAPDSPLEHALREAEPRSCLAVRFARPHREGDGHTPLLECELCSRRSTARSTCEPLHVGGEVIGSVLVQHAAALTADDEGRIKGTVMQAAPALANLRNLAIAEVRAATDALTGLPNNRALQANMKRMVAQSLRTSAPLASALLDLDHFKHVNDTYGHGKGDEVLAAVGAVLQETARESDFVGRWGGEEFLILFPEIDRDGAIVAAEKVREAVAGITVIGVDRAITASLGVAILPEDGTDVATLTRSADRALYTAKARGRNRVEAFSPNIDADRILEAPTA